MKHIRPTTLERTLPMQADSVVLGKGSNEEKVYTFGPCKKLLCSIFEYGCVVIG